MGRVVRGFRGFRGVGRAVMAYWGLVLCTLIILSIITFT